MKDKIVKLLVKVSVLFCILITSNSYGMDFVKNTFNKIREYKVGKLNLQVETMNKKFEDYSFEKIQFRKRYSKISKIDKEITKKKNLRYSIEPSKKSQLNDEIKILRKKLNKLNDEESKHHQVFACAQADRNKQWKIFTRYAVKNMPLLLMEQPKLSYGNNGTNCDILTSNELRNCIDRLLIKYPKHLVLKGFETIFFDREKHLPFSLEKTFPDVFSKHKMMKQEYDNFKTFGDI